MKPIELVEPMLQNSTAPGHLVLDPFSGSGTTLIACERIRRRCRAVEISPAYCDVEIRRWEQATGKAAVLDGTGQTFSEVAAERGEED